MSEPILYSFRRCPYAMRARLGIYYAGIKVEIREVILRDKPSSLLDYSPKGTVPVLVLSDKEVIEESIDIVRWALSHRDPQKLLPTPNSRQQQQVEQLIEQNDGEFKYCLDRYKYADRYPEFPAEHYREQGEVFIKQLEQLLLKNSYLLGKALSIADIAIAPFIRQFAHVDRNWFDNAPYPRLKLWLASIIESQAFKDVFLKYPQWLPEHEPRYFP
ncbi:MAG: glutathione S-transferase [Pseudomonadales bacterium]|nr:glutathione S-transferase [Pseudomonadales bacterium]